MSLQQVSFQPNWNGHITYQPHPPTLPTPHYFNYPSHPSPCSHAITTPVSSPTSPPLPLVAPAQNPGKLVVAPPLAVQQTKNTPLTPTAQYDQDIAVKKVGKSLSCYTKRSVNLKFFIKGLLCSFQTWAMFKSSVFYFKVFDPVTNCLPDLPSCVYLCIFSMEMVWHGEFNRLCQYFLPHHWYLSPTFTLPQGNRWLTFRDSAKVRFLCRVSW